MPGKQGDNGQGADANGKLNAPQGRPTAQDMEQLSAYLDDELDAAERAALERRLAEDAILRRALGELRQTRALLRAIPAPALPRSFALPAVGELDTLTHAHARDKANRDDGADATGPLRTMPRVQVYRRDTDTPRSIPRATPTARVAQWLGTLVAVLGLALLLGATLPAHAPSLTGGAATSSASREHAPVGATTNSPSSTAAGAGPVGTYGGVTDQHATTPSTTAPAAPTPTTAATVGAPSGGGGGATPATSLTQAWLPALGVLLLIGGVILFAYGRFARPRR